MNAAAPHVPQRPRRGAFGAWFAERSVAAKVILVLATAVVAANVAIYAVQLVIGTSSPGGATASSHATGADGYAAWAELLERSGHRVVALDTPLSDAQLTPGATVIVAEPRGFPPEDAAALQRFLRHGGRVVVAGAFAARLLAAGDAALGWDRQVATTATAAASTPEVAHVRTVTTDGAVFEQPGPYRPLLEAAGAPAALVGTVGRGRVVAVASAAVFDNAHLASTDNAAFALDVVGGPAATVYFDEAVHGYGPATGLSAIPVTWRWAGAGLLLAALVALWCRGKRFGPPQELQRRFAPPRRVHVEAVAAGLARAHDVPGAALPVWESMRARLAAQLGVAPTDPRFASAARDAAAAAGATPAELAAIERPPTDSAGLVVLGSVAARLARTDAGLRAVPAASAATPSARPDPQHGGR